MIETVSISSAVTQAVTWTKEGMDLLTTAPAIYFVGFALLTVAAGVARRFVPMKRK